MLIWLLFCLETRVRRAPKQSTKLWPLREPKIGYSLDASLKGYEIAYSTKRKGVKTWFQSKGSGGVQKTGGDRHLASGLWRHIVYRLELSDVDQWGCGKRLVLLRKRFNNFKELHKQLQENTQVSGWESGGWVGE